MTNPFRTHLRTTEFGQDRLSQLSKASLEAAEKKYFPGTNPTLTVDVLGDEVDAYVNARVSMALVESTAHFAKAATDSMNAPRITPKFRSSLGLRNLGSFGNRIILGFDQPVSSTQDAILESDKALTLAESAAQTLTRVLPEDDNDDSSLDAAGGLLVPQRIGLHKLAEELESLNRKIGLSLQVRTGERLVGQLSATQAKVLSSSLSETRNESEHIEIYGVLDGMRTRRQLFFLDTQSGHSIYGTVDDELLPHLRQFIGRPVSAKLTVYQPVRADGRRGRKSYRLTSIKPAPEQTDLLKMIDPK